MGYALVRRGLRLRICPQGVCCYAQVLQAADGPGGSPGEVASEVAAIARILTAALAEDDCLVGLGLHKIKVPTVRVRVRVRLGLGLGLGLGSGLGLDTFGGDSIYSERDTR